MANRLICEITIKERRTTFLYDFEVQEIIKAMMDFLRQLPHRSKITWEGNIRKTTEDKLSK